MHKHVKIQKGYHLTEIPKGKIGEVSKISEEFYEFLDAIQQGNKLMALLELSDLIGAIELFLKIHHRSITIEDLICMKNVTRKVFEEGYRK